MVSDDDGVALYQSFGGAFSLVILMPLVAVVLQVAVPELSLVLN